MSYVTQAVNTLNKKGFNMPLNLEESKYALEKILEVLMSPQLGINYENLKAAADRHQKRIDELEAAQQSVHPTGATGAPNEDGPERDE